MPMQLECKTLYIEMAPSARLEENVPGGAELLVLDGTLTEKGDSLRASSWLRLPEGAGLDAVAGEGGAKVWIKTGHLPYARAPQVAG